jgi:hypothetical protein
MQKCTIWDNNYLGLGQISFVYLKGREREKPEELRVGEVRSHILRIRKAEIQWQCPSFYRLKR